jgi:hypothetical protein
VLLYFGEGHGLRMFGNIVLMRIFGTKREDGEDYIMRSFINCTFHQILG